jgi:hypothetical protein
MNSAWGSYGKSMTEQAAENDSWYDCRGVSNWTNPVCWIPGVGSLKRAQEAATDLYMSSGNGEPAPAPAPAPGPGPSPGPGPQPPPYRRGGVPGWVGPVVALVVVGGLVSVVLGTRRRKSQRKKS